MVKKILIFQQILLVNTIENVYRTVRRKCILMLEYEELKSLYLTSQVKVAMASKIDDGGSLGCRFVVEFDFIVISKCKCESYCYISWKIFIPIWTLVNKLHFVFSFYFTFPIMLMNMKTKTTMTVRAIFNSHKLKDSWEKYSSLSISIIIFSTKQTLLNPTHPPCRVFGGLLTAKLYSLLSRVNFAFAILFATLPTVAPR